MIRLTGVPDVKERPSGYGPAAPVEIFQHDWEFRTLLGLYRDMQPAHVLEVGSFHGGTLYHWLREAEPGTLVVSIDRYDHGGVADNRHLYAQWAALAHARVEVIVGDSHDSTVQFKAQARGPYDWVFIDAGHWYADVKADWEAYMPMTNDEGIVCLHDILPKTPNHPDIEVSVLWEEIRRQGYVTQELVADPDAPWGGIGIVYL